MICLNCKKETKNVKFCSYNCQGTWRTKQKIKAFEEEGKTWRSVRPYLIETRGNICEECHNDTWNNKPIPLEMHHVDGDSNNNMPTNIQLLCPNCHALTDTFKAKNTGNGRHKRRERYAKGKSY